MSRKKNYNEDVVTNKAMRLFWSNGYHTTSTRMLEKEMGINLFSIYSSFQNKDGVFLASVKCYKDLIRQKLLIPLAKKPQTIATLKDFFYDFLNFTREQKSYKGCLLINTANELGNDMTENVTKEITSFSEEIRSQISLILSKQQSKNKADLTRQTNYIFVALQGVSLTAKALDKAQIDDYIEMTFLDL